MNNNNGVMAHVMTKAMRGTMGAQSRNRVGRREWTLLRMGKVFIEKLVFDWRLDLDNYQVLREETKLRRGRHHGQLTQQKKGLPSQKDLDFRRGSVECWGSLQWREQLGQAAVLWGIGSVCSPEGHSSNPYKSLPVLCQSGKGVTIIYISNKR